MLFTRTVSLTRAPLACTAIALLAIGCGGSGADVADRANTGVVRDSAGVRIVEHAGLPTALPVWTMSEAADVRIGSSEGSGPEGFGRLAGLVLLPDGGVVVAEAQALELRAFDANGAHRWSAGRGGEGPGEFISTITHFSRLGADSLLVSDGGGRTMAFGPDGTYARIVRIPDATEDYSRPRVIGALGDGMLVTASGRRIAGANDFPTGISRGTESVMMLQPSGVLGEELGAFRSLESTIVVTRSAAGAINSVAVRRLTMGRGSVYAVGGTSIVAAETDRFELFRYDAAAGPTTIIRVNVPVRLLDDEGRRHALARDSNAVVSDTLPAFATVRLDDVGRIWVQEFVPINDARAAHWWVLDGDGAFIARVEVPHGFDLRAFSGNTVWGIRLDEDDVPFVERRRIERE